MRCFPLAAILAASASLAQCQSKAVIAQFEVASVKAAPRTEFGTIPVIKGGPGTREPGRLRCSDVTLMALITKAYGVYADQVFGPDWLTSQKYSIDAVVPPGATKQQFDRMLQNLLAQRFGLVLQREERELAVYRLAVGKGGPKLRPSPQSKPETDGDEADSETAPPVQVGLDGNGCPVLQPGSRGLMGSVGTNNCTTFRRYRMSDFVRALEMMVALETGSYFGPQASQAHIVDQTGLIGEFDFEMKFALHVRLPAMASGSAPDTDGAGSGGLNIFGAIEQQLGLKLEKSKSRLAVLVVQQALKVPTEN